MTRAKLLITLGILALGFLLATQAEAAKGQLTDQETYVLQQVAKGEWADLKKKFGKKEGNRRLSARFLEDLLTGDLEVKVHRKGIMIVDAVITESLDLEQAHMPYSTYLIYCLFKEPIICRDAFFEKHFMINGSHLEKEGDFQRVKITKNFFCRNAIFRGPVNFVGADIGGQFSANGAEFNNEEEEVDFDSMKVSQHTFFRNATFQGPVIFRGADIGGQFSANGAKFNKEKEEVNFNSMSVGQHAFFEDVKFQGPVALVSAHIGGQFVADGARFLNQEHKANFNSMKVGHTVHLEHASFQGPVDFISADIGSQFKAGGAKFLNQERTANFNSMEVGQHTFFTNATFQGPVDFGRADIGGQFVADGAEFLNQRQLTFEGMRVGQRAFFRNVTFMGNVSLIYGTYLDLILEGAEFKGSGGEKREGAEVLKSLYLKETEVQRLLRLKNFTLANLEAQHLRVKGPATFEGLTIKNSADFHNANIGALEFKNVTWPEDKANFKLDGLTYNSLSVVEPNETDKFQSLLGLVEKSAFNPQNYLELEKYCTRAGHQDWADKVFIAKNNREIAQMSWYKKWAVGFFWGFLAGYGRYPFRIFLSAIIILLIGRIFFNPRYLENEFFKKRTYLNIFS